MRFLITLSILILLSCSQSRAEFDDQKWIDVLTDNDINRIIFVGPRHQLMASWSRHVDNCDNVICGLNCITIQPIEVHDWIEKGFILSKPATKIYLKWFKRECVLLKREQKNRTDAPSMETEEIDAREAAFIFPATRQPR